jgi:hypothetical protein
LQERVRKSKRVKGEDIERAEGSKVTRLTKLEQSNGWREQKIAR